MRCICCNVTITHPQLCPDCRNAGASVVTCFATKVMVVTCAAHGLHENTITFLEFFARPQNWRRSITCSSV